MKQIPLTQGKFALVDDEDFEYLNQWKWHYLKVGYAARSVKKDNKKTYIYMHREINETVVGRHTDHINNDKLDNRRHNLRSATKGQNMANVGKRAHGASSRYKGVSLDKRNRRWFSRICIGNNKIYLGRFSTEIEAAQSYNDAATKYHGEYALLNDIAV